MLVTWFVAAVWGWFFVEPTVLRDSQAAHDYVEWASKMFPWLDNIRRLVPQAEKGLYLHSVYTVALAPFSVITALVIVLRPEGKQRGKRGIPTGPTNCFLFLLCFTWGSHCDHVQRNTSA